MKSISDKYKTQGRCKKPVDINPWLVVDQYKSTIIINPWSLEFFLVIQKLIEKWKDDVYSEDEVDYYNKREYQGLFDCKHRKGQKAQ